MLSHEIRDQDWERIHGLLPAENTGEGRPSKPNRVMLNGIFLEGENRRSLA
ncbi:hypothetical protein MKN04_15440 [Paenibacillus polymyxa]|uniref:transposase n=1 Tax=Paenibacillus polymyxa TaxID=1406 RepID=UPI0009B8A1A0|nr:transposase [Paenibacillus polymyxa]MCH6189039.1 hypothetical protein [Paenibacillus polymyxa]MDY8095774.1 hypothetical protein [Paenibacillus polymyxa]WRL57865.1 hypothetical protein U3G77_06200 [Paenibacillus polymyxa]